MVPLQFAPLLSFTRIPQDHISSLPHATFPFFSSQVQEQQPDPSDCISLQISLGQLLHVPPQPSDSHKRPCPQDPSEGERQLGEQEATQLPPEHSCPDGQPPQFTLFPQNV